MLGNERPGPGKAPRGDELRAARVPEHGTRTVRMLVGPGPATDTDAVAGQVYQVAPSQRRGREGEEDSGDPKPNKWLRNRPWRSYVQCPERHWRAGCSSHGRRLVHLGPGH